MKTLLHCADIIRRTLRSLMATWDQTREGWQDDLRNQFETENINEIRAETDRYTENLQKFIETAQQILRALP